MTTLSQALTLAPFTDWPTLWAWMHEHPQAHLDDTTAPTLEAFAADMDTRLAQGESVYGVELDGHAVGAIGYAPVITRDAVVGGAAVSWEGRGCVGVTLDDLGDGCGRGFLGHVPARSWEWLRHARAVQRYSGMLHGVAISRAVSGRGVADQALRLLLSRLAQDGVRKVSATYFSDNRHIRACLKRVGFVDEGFLQDHTTRQGRPTSLWLVATMIRG